MWQLLRRESAINEESVRLIADVQRITSRLIVIALIFICIIWHVIIVATLPLNQLGLLWLVTPMMIGVYGLALWFLPRILLATQLICLLGTTAILTAILILFQHPAIGLMYAFLPFLAVVLLGWRSALLVQILIILLVWQFEAYLYVPSLVPPIHVLVLFGGVISGFLGWAATSPLTTLSEWSFTSLHQARHHMEVAQTQRARLAQIVKDLDHTYYRLERSNAALVSARKVAEEAERFKTEFVANVSHELRTPLNLIIGFSEVMMTAPESYRNIALPGPYRSDLMAIYHSAQHLRALVDDVLDMARIDAGEIGLIRETVRLETLVEEAIATMRDYITAKGLELQVHVASDLPALQLDRLRIRQVLLNLLVNAARFTERGYINVSCVLQDDEVIVQVRDSGRGIAPEDAAKIFEAFRSTNQPASTWHSGTGLGLPISKKFIELHHGRIGFDSVPAGGTTFWFTLPMIAREAPQPGSTMPRRWTPYVPLGATERIIVLAHDDPHMVSLLKRHLHGYRVLGVSGIDAAMNLALEVKALALVVSTNLPLPPLPDDLLVIQCALPSNQQAAGTLGAIDLLEKPVTRQELLAAIGRLKTTVHRVLIVDDDPEVVRLFKRMLASHPTAPSSLMAASGAEALAMLQHEQIDLMLIDLRLSVMDDRSLLATMATDAQLAQIPVIIITAEVADWETTRLPGTFQISRAAGLRMGEMLQLLKATARAVTTGWDGAAPTEPALEAGPLESQA